MGYKMQLKKWLFQQPTLFVFLSFLLGLSNFINTFLQLLSSYMLPITYPLKASLKPFFFVFQSLCFILFIYHLRNSQKLHADNRIPSLLSLQLPIFAITVFLFLLYQVAFPGKYGILPYTALIWLVCYIAGLSITSFWFGYRLGKEQNYQHFSIIFLLIGFTFLANFLSEIYFIPQTLFNYALPLMVDQIGRFTPPVLMVLALCYTWIYLTFRRSTKVSFTTVFKFVMVTVALVLPFFLNNYKDGLINMVIRAIVYWGLGYSGYDWYYASLYLVAITAYIFLIKDLSTHLDRSLASNLILLGVISLPWNGIMVYEFGYSSIPGNLLSLDALITGFFMLSKRDKLLESLEVS